MTTEENIRNDTSCEIELSAKKPKNGNRDLKILVGLGIAALIVFGLILLLKVLHL